MLSSRYSLVDARGQCCSPGIKSQGRSRVETEPPACLSARHTAMLNTEMGVEYHIQFGVGACWPCSAQMGRVISRARGPGMPQTRLNAMLNSLLVPSRGQSSQ